MARLLSRIPAQHQKPTMVWLSSIAALCCLIALLMFIGFSEKTETTGHLWWEDTRQIPYDERRPYLLWGIGLLALATIFILTALRIMIDPHARAERAEHARRVHQVESKARDEGSERREETSSGHGAFRTFLWYTMFNEGRAQGAYERGDSDFEARLRVDNGEFRQKVREIEGQGWRLVHRNLHKKDRQDDTQHATYYFVRDED